MLARKILSIVFAGIFGVALIVCFICNLAISHTLSWFFIVLCGVGIAFSAINLPLSLKSHRLLWATVGCTIFTYLLLFTCNLLAHGNWFWSIAVPIATYPVVFAWLTVLTFKLHRVNWWYRSAIFGILATILAITMNPWVYAILDGGISNFGKYFVLQFTLPEGISFIGNVILALVTLAYTIVGLSLGYAYAKRKKLQLQDVSQN